MSSGDATVSSSGNRVHHAQLFRCDHGRLVSDKLADPSRAVQGTITVTVPGKPNPPHKSVRRKRR